MDINEKDIDLLESYWLYALPEQQAKALEQRLASDASFAAAAAELKTTWEVLQMPLDQARLDKMKALQKSLPPVEEPRFGFWVKALAVAAGLALLIAAAWWLTKTQQPSRPDTKAIAMTYFEPFPAYGITKSGDEATARLQALTAYAANDFGAAIPLLKKAFEVGKDSSLLFYLGVAHLANGDAATAVETLLPLHHANIAEAEAVSWYLSLALLQAGDKEAARSTLQQVKSKSEGYGKKAEELERKIFFEKK